MFQSLWDRTLGGTAAAPIITEQEIALPEWLTHVLAGLVIAGFAALSLWYSLVVPAFETPDELYHYAFARHLALGHPLPVQNREGDGPWQHEGTQAPLYYLLLGRLIASIPQDDFTEITVPNPHANLGNPLYPGNKNHMLYSARQLPLDGANLALHVGRWFCIILGSLTVLGTYAIARLAFAESRALPLLTLFTVATIPQFAFISASLSNDSMVIFAAAAGLFWLSRLVYRPRTAAITSVDWLILGGILGVAAISKLQGLGLILIAGLAMLALAWWRWDVWLPVRGTILVALPLVSIAGWWYWRNHHLYGEWLGVNQLLTLEGLRSQPQTLANLWGELRGLRYSFWGLFGWFSILLPTWVYRLLDAITLVATAGILGSILQACVSRNPFGLLIPANRVRGIQALWAALLSGLMVYWATFAASSQGRLLFPAVSAFGVLLVGGLSFWCRRLPRAWQWTVLSLLPLGLAALSLYTLTQLLPQTYQAGAVVHGIPEDAQMVGKVYDDSLELVAVELPTQRFKPGDVVPISLYMRAIQRLNVDYELFVQLLDQNNFEIGNVTTHPGWGSNPTSMWVPGAIYADFYGVRLQSNIDSHSPVLARVYVGFMDAGSAVQGDEQLLPVAGNQTELSSRTVGFVEVVARTPWTPTDGNLRPVNVNFGDTIRLTGYQFPAFVSRGEAQGLTVTLFWEASGTPTAEYTAFVHVTTEDGQPITGLDHPPAEGRFPTNYWQPGDYSLSTFQLTLPSQLPMGKYEIWVGLYNGRTDNLEPLAIVAADRPVQDNRLHLGSVSVR